MIFRMNQLKISFKKENNRFLFLNNNCIKFTLISIIMEHYAM